LRYIVDFRSAVWLPYDQRSVANTESAARQTNRVAGVLSPLAPRQAQSTFFSLIPERLDAARVFGSLAFFMRTKARRDRVMYLCRSTPFARGHPYLYKVFAFYFDHTLGTLFSQTQHLNIYMGHSGTKANSSGLPMRTLHCSLKSSGA